MARGIPTDTLLSSQWHLGTGQTSINVRSVWPDYTGEGVIVGVIDDGFDYTHPDLTPNYRTDLDYDTRDNDSNAIHGSFDRHGTATMGIIGADDNGTGVVGVAFDSDLVGYRALLTTSGQTSLASQLVRAASNVDIVSNSWSFPNPFQDDFDLAAYAGIQSALVTLAQSGRNGLGTIAVFSGGNGRSAFDSANYHNIQNSPFTITVAAIDQDGTYSSFSSPGANILVTAPGTNVYTTDVSGAGGYTGGDFVSFGGTSASAPIVSGVIALMLEANPDLGYRDVQKILAYTSRKVDESGSVWQDNGAGLHFSHDYGFGLVDAHAAVRLAETWTELETYSNAVTLAVNGTGGIIPIPDLDGIVGTITFTNNIIIEHVLIDLTITHSLLGDLQIALVSPDGTTSILTDRVSGGTYSGNGTLGFQFSSLAHWGESSAGTWSLVILDAQAGNTGSLIDWDLTFIGRNHTVDDLILFTKERPLSVIDDTDGGVDTLNMASLTGDIIVDLRNTGGHSAGGTGFTIAQDDIIENAFGGDGQDQITGNHKENILKGGRNNDALDGKDGNDTLFGDQGQDLLKGEGGNDTLFGGDDNDILRGHGGDDELFGDDGDDLLEGYSGDDELFGGNGKDNLFGGSGKDILKGGIGNDHLVGNEGDDEIFGEEGDDTIIGGTVYSDKFASNDKLFGGAGNDTLFGYDGDDEIHGGADSDTARGGDDNDVLYGDSGIDYLWGERGNDTLYGGLGGDDLRGGRGNDEIFGEEGADYIEADEGNDIVHGGDDNDEIRGESGNDILNGDGGNDLIRGHQGNDQLFGGAGNDTLEGYQDNDLLNGGLGADTLWGGTGWDNFVLDITAFDAVDTILDFTMSEFEIIKLDNILFGFNAATDAITDFVSFTENSGDTEIHVDRDGSAAAFTSQQVANVKNVTGLDLQDLYNDGQLEVI